MTPQTGDSSDPANDDLTTSTHWWLLECRLASISNSANVQLNKWMIPRIDDSSNPANDGLTKSAHWWSPGSSCPHVSGLIFHLYTVLQPHLPNELECRLASITNPANVQSNKVMNPRTGDTSNPANDDLTASAHWWLLECRLASISNSANVQLSKWMIPRIDGSSNPANDGLTKSAHWWSHGSSCPHVSGLIFHFYTVLQPHLPN